MKNSDNFSNAPFYIPPEDKWLVSFWKRKRLMKKMSRAGLILLVIFLAVGTYLFWKNNQDIAQKNSQSDVATRIPKDIVTNTFANDVSGVSSAISKSAVDQTPQGVVSKSEKYQIREISLGGSAELLSSETQSMPLFVNDVRSEMLTAAKDGYQSRLLIRWKTNKMASSDVTYDKGGISKTLSEGGFGYSHALVLSDLEQSQRYTFVVSAVDRWGNKSQSENFSAYTGSKTGSVIDVIKVQFNDIFGWTMKK